MKNCPFWIPLHCLKTSVLQPGLLFFRARAFFRTPFHMRLFGQEQIEETSVVSTSVLGCFRPPPAATNRLATKAPRKSKSNVHQFAPREQIERGLDSHSQVNNTRVQPSFIRKPHQVSILVFTASRAAFTSPAESRLVVR